MKVLIRKIDKKLELPEYKTAGAAGMDCVARVDTEIAPGVCGMVPLNIAIKPPRGHFVLLVARSSLHKRGLMLANGVGICDEDFSGDDDEYNAVIYNFTHEPVKVLRGERIVQILVLPFNRVEWDEVDTLATKSRGGFGTTGV
ncbi:MAG TPA: dUTP diphosphatase [Candidatus Kaiserbacteria bacterium]|nr:dUTP diphosphatase [Candidatus Kaiserbacteria bacterium]